MASRTVVPGTRHWPLAALLLASVLWGGAITGTKYALRAFDPVTLLGVELAAATAALWAVLLIRGYRPPPSWPAAVLLGLLELRAMDDGSLLEAEWITEMRIRRAPAAPRRPTGPAATAPLCLPGRTFGRALAIPLDLPAYPGRPRVTIEPAQARFELAFELGGDMRPPSTTGFSSSRPGLPSRRGGKAEYLAA